MGVALSAEKNFPALLEKILVGAKNITNADGGTIYLLTPEKKTRDGCYTNRLFKPSPWC